MTRKEHCPICNGRGRVYNTETKTWETCWVCKGSGWIDIDQAYIKEDNHKGKIHHMDCIAITLIS